MSVSIMLSILLVVSFVGTTIWKEKELPDSISAMVWVLPEGCWRWLWSIWLVAVSILTFAPAVGILDARGLGVFGFLPMVCLGFVAVLPLFDHEHVKWHYVMAVVGGILSQVTVAFINPWWLSVWLLMAVALWKPLRSKAVMISECLCYVAMVGAQTSTALFAGRSVCP